MVKTPPKLKTTDGQAAAAGKKTVRLSVPQKGFTFIASLISFQFRNGKAMTHCHNPLFVFITNCYLFSLKAWAPQPNIKAGRKSPMVAEKGQFEEPPHRRDTSTPQRRASPSASSSPRSPAAGPSSLPTPPSKTHTREPRHDALKFFIPLNPY